MEKLFRFVGALLAGIGETGGGLGWAIFLFTLMVAGLMLIPIVSEIRSLQLADKIRPLHESVLKKFQSRPERMAKELVGMHKAFGYHTLLGMFSHLVHAAVIVLLAGTFFQADLFLSAFPEGARGFLWIRDLTVSPFGLIRQGRFVPELIAAIFSLLLLDILLSWNARVIMRKSLMPVDTLYKCLIWAAMAAAFFTPQAVLVYLSVFYLTKNIIFIVFVSLFPYSLNPSQEAFYEKCLRNVR